MKKLDSMSISEARAVYTSRWYPGGTDFRGYIPGMYSRARIETLINSGKYAVTIQIRNHNGRPSPFVFIGRNEA